MKTIPQGARSVVSLTHYQGKTCIHKTYDDRKTPKATKLNNEVMFYRRYATLDAIPQFLATDDLRSIWIEYRPGLRHIDLVKNGLDLAVNDRISLDYGRKAAAFLQFDQADPLPGSFDMPSHINRTLDLLLAAKLQNPGHYQVYKDYFSQPINSLLAFQDTYWLAPMLSKTDFSSANLLVVDDRISCIYDFDTAHRVNRVLFLGNCLKNCFHPTIPRLLDWRLVKESLSASSDALPPDEVLC